METRGSKTNARRLTKQRTLVTIVALAVLVAGVLVVWLIDDRDVGLVLALAAILVGWVVALILARPRGDPPVCLTQATEGSSRRKCNNGSRWQRTPAQATWTDCSGG